MSKTMPKQRNYILFWFNPRDLIVHSQSKSTGAEKPEAPPKFKTDVIKIKNSTLPISKAHYNLLTSWNETGISVILRIINFAKKYPKKQKYWITIKVCRWSYEKRNALIQCF